MDFNLAEYLSQTGFSQTSESDKRDIFEKKYYQPFNKKDCFARITIHYDAGYSKFNNASVCLMTVDLTDNFDSNAEGITIYNGLAPSNFDFAVELFEQILPGEKELKEYNG
jgi:uncharacterized hydantoinase/oxoprolinase family protein